MKTKMITTRNLICFFPLFGLILLIGLTACSGENEDVVERTAVTLPLPEYHPS